MLWVTFYLLPSRAAILARLWSRARLSPSSELLGQVPRPRPLRTLVVAQARVPAWLMLRAQGLLFPCLCASRQIFSFDRERPALAIVNLISVSTIGVATGVNSLVGQITHDLSWHAHMSRVHNRPD